MGTAPVLLLQAVAASDVETIAWAQMVMSIVMVALLVLAIAGAIVSYNTLKALGRLIKEMEEVTKRLAPRADPIIDGATRVFTNLSDVSTTLRGDVDQVQDTLREMNYRLRRAADSAESRVREFGDVLRIAQDEAQELILGATATARGVHAAADTMREAARPHSRRARGRGVPPVLEPDDDDLDELDDLDDFDDFDDDDDDFLED